MKKHVLGTKTHAEFLDSIGSPTMAAAAAPGMTG
jgi:hypothetical protein